jgi:prepilin-type processing-associated H-X9-DG protein/prepilin-type N-terminal cleavage/methylation domain-containing protein
MTVFQRFKTPTARSTAFTLIELPAVSGRKRVAFTLIELLVVITIISILAILVVPTLGKAKRSALRTNCASNLKQIGVATKMYLLDHNNVFPPVSDWRKYGVIASYYTPYMNEAYSVFRCPAQKTYLPGVIPLATADMFIPGTSNEWTSYEFNGFFAYPSNSYVRAATGRDISDPSLCAYAYDYPYNTNSVYTPHAGGANVLYTDWHVAWLSAEEYGLEKPYNQQFFGKGHL